MKSAVIVYKEPGKEPEFKKINISMEEFQSLVGGNISVMKFETFCIVYNSNSLDRPNVYLNTNQLGFDKSLRGNIFAINKDEETGEFSTLNKEQAMKCRKIFIDESFDYSNYDEHGNYIGFRKRKKNKNKNYRKNVNSNPPLPPVIKNGMQTGDPVIDELVKIPGVELVKVEDDQNTSSQTNENEKLAQKNEAIDNLKNLPMEDETDDFDNESTLKLILSIQSVILQWIKDNSNQ